MLPSGRDVDGNHTNLSFSNQFFEFFPFATG